MAKVFVSRRSTKRASPVLRTAMRSPNAYLNSGRDSKYTGLFRESFLLPSRVHANAKLRRQCQSAYATR